MAFFWVLNFEYRALKWSRTAFPLSWPLNYFPSYPELCDLRTAWETDVASSSFSFVWWFQCLLLIFFTKNSSLTSSGICWVILWASWCKSLCIWGRGCIANTLHYSKSTVLDKMWRHFFTENFEIWIGHIQMQLEVSSMLEISQTLQRPQFSLKNHCIFLVFFLSNLWTISLPWRNSLLWQPEISVEYKEGRCMHRVLEYIYYLLRIYNVLDIFLSPLDRWAGLIFTSFPWVRHTISSLFYRQGNPGTKETWSR